MSNDDVLAYQPPPPAMPQDGWMPATRQAPIDDFLGKQDPSNAVDVDNKDSPLEYFNLIFTNELLDIIVEETSRYAMQYLAANPLSFSAWAKAWKSIDEEELTVFLGLIMLMGIVQKKGRYDLYWSKNKLIRTLFFNECMARNRFQIISSFLHFKENPRLPENTKDKLYKVCLVYDLIANRWGDLYNLGEHITIDEGMLK